MARVTAGALRIHGRPVGDGAAQPRVPERLPGKVRERPVLVLAKLLGWQRGRVSTRQSSKLVLLNHSAASEHSFKNEFEVSLSFRKQEDVAWEDIARKAVAEMTSSGKESLKISTWDTLKSNGCNRLQFV